MNTQDIIVLNQETRKVLGRIQDNRRRLNQVQTLREMVELSECSVPAWIRHQPTVSQELLHLRQAAEQRLSKWVDRQMTEVMDLPEDEKKSRLIHLYRDEWALLRGIFPFLAQKVNRFWERERSALNKSGQNSLGLGEQGDRPQK